MDEEEKLTSRSWVNGSLKNSMMKATKGLVWSKSKGAVKDCLIFSGWFSS